MAKIKELRDQAEDFLETRVLEIDKTLYDLRTELKMNRKLEKPHLLKELKKQKAQILTILSERKRGNK